MIEKLKLIFGIKKKGFYLSELGICPICLDVVAGFVNYNEDNFNEYVNNLCSKCGSEAIDSGYVNLLKFLKENELHDLEAMLSKWKDVKEKIVENYWKKRLLSLKNIIELRKKLESLDFDDYQIKI